MTTTALNEQSRSTRIERLRDTATERIPKLTQPPCKRNRLHDPHTCHCPAPCPACVNHDEKFWKSTLPRLDASARNLIENFIVEVRACDFYSREFNIALPELLYGALRIEQEARQ